MGKKIVEIKDVMSLHQKGELQLAKLGYLKLLEADPGNSDALHLFGVINFQEGNFLRARDLINQAIQVDKTKGIYFANLGRIEKSDGNLEEAKRAFCAALAISPEDYEINIDLSAIYIELGNYELAINSARKVLKKSPSNPGALLNLGIAQLNLGSNKSALLAFRKACMSDPNHAEAHFQYGRALQEAGNMDLATIQYKKVIKLNPEMAEAHCNLGNIFRERTEFIAALKSYSNAIKINPQLSEIYANKGIALQEMGKPLEAVKIYRKALVLSPNDAEIHRNLSMALLQVKEFKEGWKEFEWRWETEKFKIFRRNWEKPQWSGQDIQGKKILVHSEQGFGDSIQFSRYLPMLTGRGAKVIVECPLELCSLLRQIEGVSETTNSRETLRGYDFHVPMMSLAGLFDEKLVTASSGLHYIPVPKSKIKQWQSKIQKLCPGPNIGLVWRGSPNHLRDSLRSIKLELFEPLLDLENVNLFFLQKDLFPSEIKFLRSYKGGTDLSHKLTTFMETAGAISNLDFVITPDTATAHLSGAIGKEVWILLPEVSEWRWFDDKKCTPWYNSARLYRQTTIGNWEKIVTQLCSEIKRRANK